MLRSRSRAVTSKNQALMTDHSSQSSSSPSSKNQSKPNPSFLCSPRFKAFIFKGFLHESDSATIAMSPTSILDTTKPPFFSSFKNQFWHHDPTTNQSPKSPRNFPDSKGIGIVALMDDKPNPDHDKPCSKVIINGASVSQPSNIMVLFGTKLKVLIPPPLSNSPFSPSGSPPLSNPSAFEIKTQFSASEGSSSSSNSGKESPSPPKVFMSEMEMSEDYTCVISRGPKPKTTHIFDNCIVEENYCSLSSDYNSNNNNVSVLLNNNNNFLSFCFTCKKNLEQKNDIYIYRGDKAFCSQECRYKEMILDEIENL